MTYTTYPSRGRWLSLIINHADAWGLTCTITSLGLILHGNFTLQHIPLLLAVTVSYWMGFAVNDYFDAKYDGADVKKASRNFFCQVHVPKEMLFGSVLLIQVAVFIVFASYGMRGVLMYAVAILVMWAYSASPIRLKNRPGLDLLTHALFVQTFPYWVAIAVPKTSWDRIDGGLLLMFILASLAAQLEQQVRDFHVDSQFESNFTIWFGLKPTRLLLKFITTLLGIHVIAMIVLGVLPTFLLPYILIAMPIMLHRFVRGKRNRSESLVRFSVILSLAYTLIVWVGVLSGYYVV